MCSCEEEVYSRNGTGDEDSPESLALLEITALKKDHATRTFDIVAAFLIGTDRGAQTGEYVYMRPPPEWWPIFQEWVRGYPPTAELNRMIDEEIPKHCEIQSGPLEVQGVSVEVLGKTKARIPGAILIAGSQTRQQHHQGSGHRREGKEPSSLEESRPHQHRTAQR